MVKFYIHTSFTFNCFLLHKIEFIYFLINEYTVPEYTHKYTYKMKDMNENSLKISCTCLSLQNFSKIYYLNRKRNFTRCSSVLMVLFMNKIHMYFLSCLPNWKITILVEKSICRKQWIHFSMFCIKRCLPF